MVPRNRLPRKPLDDDEKLALWLLAIGRTQQEIVKVFMHQFDYSLSKSDRTIQDAYDKLDAFNQKEVVSKAIALNIVPIEKVRDYFGISPDEAAESSMSQATMPALEGSLRIESPQLPDVPSSFQYYPPDTHAFDAELTQAWKQFGYLPTVAMEYEEKLAAIYQFDDDRILYKKELGVHTLPYDLYVERLRPTIVEGGEKARIGFEMLRCTKLSQDAFHEHVPRGRSFKDIASMRTIRQSLAQRIPSRDEWLLNLGAQPLRRDDVLRQLATVVSYLNNLKKYPTYELALVDDFKDELMEEGSWAVKRSRALYLENWEHDEQGRRIKTHFDSTDVAEIRRRQDYFYTLWHDKTKVISDRREVIDFIQQEVIRALAPAATEQ